MVLLQKFHELGPKARRSLVLELHSVPYQSTLCSFFKQNTLKVLRALQAASELGLEYICAALDRFAPRKNGLKNVPKMHFLFSLNLLLSPEKGQKLLFQLEKVGSKLV